jgi:hypothetical protein
MLWRAPADFEIQGRIDELEEFRSYSPRSEQLKQALTGSDLAARVTSNVYDETFLGKSLRRDYTFELFHESIGVVRVEAKQANVSEVSSIDSADLSVEHVRKLLVHSHVARTHHPLLPVI